MDKNKIVVTDDQGVERSLEVLFTFSSDETGKKYVLYYDPSEEQPSVFASSFDDEGHLFEVETPSEWDMIEEVFQSFMAEDEESGCGCGGQGCCHDGEDHECECGGHGDCCH